MFYSTQILSKKGPLGVIWIAAHLDKRLKRHQINETNISGSVDSIINPEAPLALRLSGQLLLGLVRIYSRKVGYLFHDVNDILLRIQQAFRDGTVVDLPADGLTAPLHAITLPDAYDDVDWFGGDGAAFAFGPFEQLGALAPSLQHSLGSGRRDSLSLTLVNGLSELYGSQHPLEDDEQFEVAGAVELERRISMGGEVEQLRAEALPHPRTAAGLMEGLAGRASSATRSGGDAGAGAAGEAGVDMEVDGMLFEAPDEAASLTKALAAMDTPGSAAASARDGGGGAGVVADGSPVDLSALLPDVGGELELQWEAGGLPAPEPAPEPAGPDAWADGAGGGPSAGVDVGEARQAGGGADGALPPAAAALHLSRKRRVKLDVLDGQPHTELPGHAVRALLKDRSSLLVPRGRKRARHAAAPSAAAARWVVAAQSDAAARSLLYRPAFTEVLAPELFALYLDAMAPPAAAAERAARQAERGGEQHGTPPPAAQRGGDAEARPATLDEDTAVPAGPQSPQRQWSGDQRDGGETGADAAALGRTDGRASPSLTWPGADGDADAVHGAAAMPFSPASGGGPTPHVPFDGDADMPASSGGAHGRTPGSGAWDGVAAEAGHEMPQEGGGEESRRGWRVSEVSLEEEEAGAASAGGRPEGMQPGDTRTGFTARTRKVLAAVQEQLAPQDARGARSQQARAPLSLSSLVADRPRGDAARWFFELLVLKSQGYVELDQADAYADIAITGRPALGQA